MLKTFPLKKKSLYPVLKITNTRITHQQEAAQQQSRWRQNSHVFLCIFFEAELTRNHC